MQVDPTTAIILAVQGWTCKELISVKLAVARLEETRKPKRKIMRSILFLILFTSGAFLLSGCGTPNAGKGSTFGGILSATPNVTTNQAGQVETNSFSYQPSTEFIAGTKTGSAVASFVPPPYGTAVDLGIKGVAAIAGLLAGIQTYRSGKKQEQLDSATGQLVSVVQAIEQVAKKGGSAQDVKPIAEALSKVAGVRDDLAATVLSQK